MTKLLLRRNKNQKLLIKYVKIKVKAIIILILQKKA